MKTRITKQVKSNLKNIIDMKGYWSTEVRQFIEQFDLVSQRTLHQLSQVYDKYPNMSELNSL